MKRNAILSFILTFITTPLLAVAGGSSVRGGGDPCENRIKNIREDISSWIDQGGAEYLQLPEEMTLEKYTQSMEQQISKARIQCVGQGDTGYPVQINGTPKVCQFKRSSNASLIVCDYQKFLSLDESEQYVLIHHEFAGLAGLELPNGSDSTYTISNQISDYLENETIKKLAVKQRPAPATRDLPKTISLSVPFKDGTIQVEVRDLTELNTQPYPYNIRRAMEDFQQNILRRTGKMRLFFVAKPAAVTAYDIFPWQELRKAFRKYHEGYKGCGSFNSNTEKVFTSFFAGHQPKDWPQVSNYLGRFFDTYTSYIFYRQADIAHYTCDKVGGYNEDSEPWYSVTDTVLFQSFSDAVPREIKAQYDSAILVFE